MAKKHHHQDGAQRDAILTAALELARERGWRGLSLADIAARAGLPLAELLERTPSKAAMLEAYVRHVDKTMLDGGVETEGSARDRLFDVAMRRFEAMAPDRQALAAILRESGDDPWALVCGARRFLKSMALTLEAAGISSSGLGGLARTQALAASYLYALRAFLKDDSADLSRTMAALDKALGRAESLATLMWRRRPTPEPPAHDNTE